MKLLNYTSKDRFVILSLFMIFIVLSACSNDDEPKYKTYNPRIDLEIEGLDSECVKKESEDFYYYVASMPASGADFVVRSDDEDALLNYMLVNNDSGNGIVFYNYDADSDGFVWPDKEGYWGSFHCNSAKIPFAYSFHISPNEDDAPRNLLIVFNSHTIGVYRSTVILITQSAAD